MNTTVTCENCKFAMADEHEPRVLRCRLNPPTVLLYFDSNESNVVVKSLLPSVRPNSFCREFVVVEL